MTALRIEVVAGDEMLEQWCSVHNAIVPPAAMTPEDVRERSSRNRLANAYVGGELVGCSTVRPPDADAIATVIARILPAYRRQGYGTSLYEDGLEHARRLGAEGVATVVLAANDDGLHFAIKRGFVETDRYVLDGETDEWIDLARALPG